MSVDQDNFALYREFVRERHQVWLRRQLNEPPPWTNHPQITKLKFTNMFRVLDPGSQFVFELGDEDPATVITRCFFYRITNLPETWWHLSDAIGDYPSALHFVEHDDIITRVIKDRHEDGHKVFSGAYVILPEPGTKNSKIEGAVRITKKFVEDSVDDFLNADTQEAKYDVLRASPGIGQFLAMQIITDWNYLQEDEPDLSFVKAGPGAQRGAKLINPDLNAEHVIHDMSETWFHDPDVRVCGRGLTPMDVQNTLCEFSKLHREIQNPRKVTDYRPKHSGDQPPPILPKWW